jgi:hypothetical protein
VISSPGCAGRQCSAIAPGAARSSSASSSRRERGAPLVGGLLVAHAHPDVGVDGVRAGDGLGRIGRQLRVRRAGQRVALRRGDRNLDARERAEQRQRPRDVVAVADICDAQPLETTELLAQRHEVGECLAGVMTRGEHVEHRHGRGAGELLQQRVGSGADADGGHVPREDPGGVADGLAARELQLTGAQDDRLATELEDPGLEGQPRARRRPLEDERDAAPLERARRQRGGLQRVGAVQQRAQLVTLELGPGQQVTRQAGQSMGRCWC